MRVFYSKNDSPKTTVMIDATKIAVLPIDAVERIARDAYEAGRVAGEIPAKA